LLGANMYTSITFDTDTLVTVDINDEAHYISGENCIPKNADDVINFGTKYINGYITTDGIVRTNDINLRYPVSKIKNKFPFGLFIQKYATYSDWMNYDVVLQRDNNNIKLRLFVNEKEVIYEDIFGKNHPKVDMGIKFEYLSKIETLLTGKRKIAFELSIVTNGDIYGNPEYWQFNNLGFNNCGCYAQWTPAKPVPAVRPSNYNDKTEYMKQYDKVLKIYRDNISYYFNSGVYDSGYSLIDTIRENIKNNNISCTTAVLMGAIQIDDTVIKEKYPIKDNRYEIQKYLIPQMFYSYIFPYPVLVSSVSPASWWKRYIWYNIYKDPESAPLAVYWQYITPSELRENALWLVMSEDKKKEVPEITTPSNSEMMWDKITFKCYKETPPGYIQ